MISSIKYKERLQLKKKKQRKEKQAHEKMLHDFHKIKKNLVNLNNYIGSGIESYHQEEYVKLSDVFTIVDNQLFTDIELYGVAIGCPSELRVYAFDHEKAYYNLVDENTLYSAKTSNILIKKNQ